jgi:NADH-quinone oxidoreductase subunit M
MEERLIAMLTIFTFIPIIAGLILLAMRVAPSLARRCALTVAVIELILCFSLAAFFDRASTGMQFESSLAWAAPIGLKYHVGIDGISLLFALLSSLVFLMSLIASPAGLKCDSKYFGLVLLLEGGLLGVFTTLNFLHFFFYWELSLFPAFFLVRNYGGAFRSEAALQFFTFTMAGSIAMLLGFLGLFLATGTFDFSELARIPRPALLMTLASRLGWTGLTGANIKLGLFLLTLLGFAVKLPIWPLHGWLPATYQEAPSPVVMLLTGAMSKMAVYGLVRILVPIYPDEIIALKIPLLTLAAITILYGAFAALAQTDLKRLFAYASLSHLGYCALGAFAVPQKIGLLYRGSDAALTGILLQAFSHGILAAALFAFVSFLEKRNDGRVQLDLFGGLRNINPVFAGMAGWVLFAALGLPGLSAFPAEFLIFQSVFAYSPLIASCAILSILVTAIYLLTFFMKVFLGPLNARFKTSPDLLAIEKAAVFPALSLTLLLGIFPQLLTTFLNPAVTQITSLLRI